MTAMLFDLDIKIALRAAGTYLACGPGGRLCVSPVRRSDAEIFLMHRRA